MIAIYFMGVMLSIVGGILLILAAFRHGFLDGILYIFMPFFQIYFLIRHWQEAKSGFLISLAGAALIILSTSSVEATLDNQKISLREITTLTEQVALNRF